MEKVNVESVWQVLGRLSLRELEITLSRVSIEMKLQSQHETPKEASKVVSYC